MKLTDLRKMKFDELLELAHEPIYKAQTSASNNIYAADSAA